MQSWLNDWRLFAAIFGAGITFGGIVAAVNATKKLKDLPVKVAQLEVILEEHARGLKAHDEVLSTQNEEIKKMTEYRTSVLVRLEYIEKALNGLNDNFKAVLAIITKKDSEKS